ncbi:YecA family protein [Cytobacillus horneckiae]|uniref:YecA family protein n=1 Tax=Cytobacillus horneckiae TaxID=549687 RepID=UPI003D232793
MQTAKVSRNEPCPCGSGIKYKKCCAKKETISITEMIDNEIFELQKELRIFAYQRYGNAMKQEYQNLMTRLEDTDADDAEFFEFMQPFWYIHFKPLNDGETIMEKFIKYKMPSLVRPRLQEVLQSWDTAIPVAGKVIGLEGKDILFVDALTDQHYTVVLSEQMSDFSEGWFAFGILLPYEQKFSAFPCLFEVSEGQAADYEGFIKAEYAESGFNQPQTFLTEKFLEMMHRIPQAAASVDMESYEWPSEGAKEVASQFEQDMEAAGELRWVINFGIGVWVEYCKKTNKKIQKPANYVAALRYLVYMVAETEGQMTQKELGEKYEISASRVSSYYKEIHSHVESFIEDLLDQSKSKEMA